MHPDFVAPPRGSLPFGKAWTLQRPRRIRLLMTVALILAVAVPAVAAIEAWEIDAVRLPTMLNLD